MRAARLRLMPGSGVIEGPGTGTPADGRRDATASTSSRRSPPRAEPSQGVALELLDAHLGTCVREAIDGGGPEADAKIAEATAAIARLVKS